MTPIVKWRSDSNGSIKVAGVPAGNGGICVIIIQYFALLNIQMIER